MNRRMLLASLVLLVSLAACSSMPSASSADALLGGLTSQLGITETQAAGGVGTYLGYAQEKLAKGDFDKIAALVPGASKYVDQAKSLGALAGPLNNVSGLNSALGKLGMNADTVSKFTPAVTNYLSKAGGSSVSSLLGGLF